MKVGIVTLIHGRSIGGFLQAYALSTKLNNLGYEAEVIDFKIPTSSRFVKLYLSFVVAVKEFFRNPLSTLVKTFKRLSKSRQVEGNKNDVEVFHDFFYFKTPHSSRRYDADTFYSVPLEYDVYVTGSDQVWNFAMTSRLDVYFLQFVRDRPKVAYAASFGFDTLPFFLKNKYRRLISCIDCVSVREKSARRIVKQISNKPVCNVLDPTLLLEMEEWLRVSKKVDLPQRNYILFYDLIGSEWAKEKVSGLATVLCCDVITPSGCSPDEFLTLMANASYVVTSSFHGVAFAINFRRRFSAFCRPSKATNARIEDLLSDLGLSSRLVYEGEGDVCPQCSIDYDKVDERLRSMRNSSVEYIKNALSLN